MDNCTYNKFKLVHELSRVKWFIDQFARKDAKSAKHDRCHKILDDLHKDVVRHIRKLHNAIDPKKL